METLREILADSHMSIAATVLIAGGLVFLITGALSACKMLEAGHQGRSWKVMVGLIFAFIVGYIVFAWALNSGIEIPLEQISAGLFLAGGIFVWLVIRNARATVNDILRVRALEAMANTDPLTGLGNRRFLDANLEHELERCKRYNRPCSLILFDVDHFKTCNDTRGHDFGDHVLVELGRIMRTFHRSTDIAARFGGEEFVLVLSETGEDGAVYAAERLRGIIEEHDFGCETLGDGERVSVTVSLGVAQYSPETDTCIGDLVRRADKALYVAKENGRNQVIVDHSDATYIGADIRPSLATRWSDPGGCQVTT